MRIPFVVTLVVTSLVAFAGDSNVLTDFGGAAPAAGAEGQLPKPPSTGSTASPTSTSARKKAVDQLKRVQHADGGWSSGAHGTSGVEAQSDVATTSYVVMALLRDAHGTDVHDAAVRKGVEHVVRAVETAPEEGPRLNTPEGTQIQYKVGQLVDTNMASMMLGEVAGTLGGDLDRRVKAALQVTIDKIERAQNADGSFDGNGWAPVLSSSVAKQSLDRANELGIDVDDSVMAKADSYVQTQVDTTTGSVDASAGAGVSLYAVATSLGGNSATAERVDGPSAAPAEVRQQAKKEAQAARALVTGDTGALMNGFGSIGGEEMLSYQMISDSMAATGGSEWLAWEKKVEGVLVQAQNADGTWVGHHCITSQAFTTAGGVMVLAAGDWASYSKARG